MKRQLWNVESIRIYPVVIKTGLLFLARFSFYFYKSFTLKAHSWGIANILSSAPFFLLMGNSLAFASVLILPL